MKLFKNKLIRSKTISILSFTLVLIISGCMETSQDEPPEQLVKTVNVEFEELKPENFSSYLRVIGTIEASDDITVSAEVSGQLMNFYKKDGDQVKRGEVIAKIDDRKLQQESRRLQAVTKQSEENYLRLKRLYEQENIGSEIDFLNAKYTYEQNLAALESVQVDIGNSEITSPVNGVIETRMLEEGEMVSNGMPVVRILGNKQVKVTFGVPARFSNVVDIGDQAEIWFDHNPENIYRLPISFVGGSVDPQSRTFRVEVLFRDPGSEIKVNMLANVKLRTQFLQKRVVISEEFIHQKNGSHVAYVAGTDENGNNIAVERKLEFGPSFGSSVVINKGLQFGEKLLTVGSSYLLDSTRIEIVNNADEFATSND